MKLSIMQHFQCGFASCVVVHFYNDTHLYELPPIVPEGSNRKEVVPFPLVSVTFLLVPNADNGFLQQLGAERVPFVLQWPGDVRPQRSEAARENERERERDGGIVKSVSEQGCDGGMSDIGGLQECSARRR